MGRKRNYSASYKREAVAKAEASGNVSQTARDLCHRIMRRQNQHSKQYIG